MGDWIAHSHPGNSNLMCCLLALLLHPFWDQLSVVGQSGKQQCLISSHRPWNIPAALARSSWVAHQNQGDSIRGTWVTGDAIEYKRSCDPASSVVETVCPGFVSWGEQTTKQTSWYLGSGGSAQSRPASSFCFALSKGFGDLWIRWLNRWIIGWTKWNQHFQPADLFPPDPLSYCVSDCLWCDKTPDKFDRRCPIKLRSAS